MVRKPLSCVAAALLFCGAALPALAATGACTINGAVDAIEADDINQEASSAHQAQPDIAKIFGASSQGSQPQ